MTAPRQVVPNTTHFLTRSTTQQLFLLRPSPFVRQTYEFLLGVAARRFEILVHSFVCMSTHQHIIFTDTRGNYPEFLAFFDRLIARSVNAHWGRWENLWSSEQPNVIQCAEKSDALEKALYAMANPVQDDLVERVIDWPGASSFEQIMSGKDRVVARPKGGFFKATSKLPTQVVLKLSRIPGYEDLTDAEWIELIRTGIETIEQRERSRRQREGKRVLGRKAILSAHHTDTPKTLRERSRTRPVLACHNLELRRELLGLRKAFLVAHRAALLQLMAGMSGTVFPFGTYRVRRFGVRCDDGRGGILHARPPIANAHRAALSPTGEARGSVASSVPSVG